ncbi:MAG: hypothetical protein ACRD19_00715 [Terriglobia bacterium]
MRKFAVLLAVLVSLSVPLCTFVVRAGTNVSSIYDVKLGMNMADVLAGLQAKYSIAGPDVSGDLSHYSITGGPDPRYDYEIMALNGKVASVWTIDAKAYSGDTLTVGNELFDALYAAAQPRYDKVGEAMGVRDLNVSVQLQKPTFDSSSRDLIFEIPGEDFRLSFLNAPDGTPELRIQRVRALDEKAIQRLSVSH